MRCGVSVAVGLAAAGTLALLAAGCGGGSPKVANVASTTTTARTSAATPPVTTTQHRTRPASSIGGTTVGGRGGAHPFAMSVADTPQGRRFSACMREHGVQNFPDPSSQGGIFVTGVDPTSPSFRSAMSVCRGLLPAGFGAPPSAARLAKVQQQLLAFSNCMHARGIADFPDPSGAALPMIQQTGDLDPNNPRFQAAYDACKAHLPAGVPAKALGGLVR